MLNESSLSFCCCCLKIIFCLLFVGWNWNEFISNMTRMWHLWHRRSQVCFCVCIFLSLWFCRIVLLLQIMRKQVVHKVCSLFCLFFDCFFDMFVDCCRVCLQHPNLFCAFFHSQRPYWTIEVTFYNKRKTQRKETKFNENMFETSQKFIEYRTEFYCWIWKFRAIYRTSKWQSLSSLVRYHQHTNTFMQQKKTVRETQKCTPTLSLEMRAKKLWKKVLDMEHHIGRIGEAL